MLARQDEHVILHERHQQGQASGEFCQRVSGTRQFASGRGPRSTPAHRGASAGCTRPGQYLRRGQQAQANAAVFLALINPGDTVVGRACSNASNWRAGCATYWTPWQTASFCLLALFNFCL